MKTAEKEGKQVEEQAPIHRIRITLTSTNVRSLEKVCSDLIKGAKDKDLKVKGSSSVIKRGTVVKNIRLTDDPNEVEGKVEKSMMVLKAEFLKKA
jgi:protein PhnA